MHGFVAGKGVRCSREVRADRRNARACGTKPMYKSKSVKLHEAVQKQCFSLDDLYQSLTWSERHCFCGNVAFSETARRQDSSFIKHIGRHLGHTYVSRGIIGRAPQTTSQVVSPFCARGFTYQSLSPSLPALARSILRCNLPKVVIVSSFVG